MNRPVCARTLLRVAADGGSGTVGENDYNEEDHPRVPKGDPSGHGGEWTKKNSDVAASIPLALPSVAGAALDLAPTFLRPLSGLAAAGLGGLAALTAGLILLPLNNSQIDAGVVPGNPDIHYHYDQGFLTIAQAMPDGEWEVLYSGRPNANGDYVTPDGAIIGRDIGNGVYLNAAAVARRRRASIVARADARADNKVRYCPAPGPDRKNGASERSIAYQMYISGLPRGIAVTLNGVVFDGCNEITKRMLEAKGEGFEWALDGNDFSEWYKGRGKIIEQMMRQSIAAKGRIIEWHVADERVAEVLKRLASPFENIEVIWTPPPWRLEKSGK